MSCIKRPTVSKTHHLLVVTSSSPRQAQHRSARKKKSEEKKKTIFCCCCCSWCFWVGRSPTLASREPLRAPPPPPPPIRRRHRRRRRLLRRLRSIRSESEKGTRNCFYVLPVVVSNCSVVAIDSASLCGDRSALSRVVIGDRSA